MSPQRKVTVWLDDELLAELEAMGQDISLEVTRSVQDELEKRRRHGRLAGLLDRLDAERGPVEEGMVEKYLELLR